MQRPACRVAGLPVRLLVDDRVDRDRGLAGLAVADDQLALAAADRGHRVDGLDAGLQRLLDALRSMTPGACSSRARRALGDDLAQAVDRLAERVDHPAEEAVADGTERTSPVRLTSWPSSMPENVAEDDDADLADVEVERDAERAVLELQQLVGHRRGQALDAWRCRHRRRSGQSQGLRRDLALQQGAHERHAGLERSVAVRQRRAELVVGVDDPAEPEQGLLDLVEVSLPVLPREARPVRPAARSR
jgi:hypothetical protein